MALGKLSQVDLRQEWSNEAIDFTPWVASDDQMNSLGAALGLELELVNTEVPVGPYSADILARDAGSDKLVVIENQLEKTNHDHLGKSITYASVLDASSIVWIAREFTEEHKKALDWLNDHTTDDVGFYAVVVELWRIDDSRPAVRFNVVSRPTNIVKQANVSKTNEELTETRKLQFEFWNEFRQQLLSRKEITSAQAARPQYWFDVSLGRTGIHLSNVANTFQNIIGVRVYLHNTVSDRALEQLMEQRDTIETAIGTELNWNPNPQNRDKIISLNRSADLRQKTEWKEYVEWLVDYTIKFRTVFSPIVKKLKLEKATDEEEKEAT